MQQSSSIDSRRSLMPTEHTSYKRKRDMNYNATEEWYPKIESLESYMPNNPSTSASSPTDGREIFGQYVASKLRKMDKSMQLLSERLIAEVLFRGQVGELSRKTFIGDEELVENSNEKLYINDENHDILSKN